MDNENPLHRALRRIFTPIAKLAIANGINFQITQNILRQAFVDSAIKDFQVDGKGLTESRISLLTGLQRREIKTRLESPNLPSENSNHIERLHSELLSRAQDWISQDEFYEISRALHKAIHPRTFKDEFLRLELLIPEGDGFKIAQTPIITSGEKGYDIFGKNMRAHLYAGVENLLGAPPQLEQAAYAVGLTAEDVKKLEKLARDHIRNALLDINTQALKMRNEKQGTQNYHFGAYFHISPQSIDKMET